MSMGGAPAGPAGTGTTAAQSSDLTATRFGVVMMDSTMSQYFLIGDKKGSDDSSQGSQIEYLLHS